MIELDHLFVVICGLILSCFCYEVPLNTVLIVIVCGCLVYVRNKYKCGWRVAIGRNGVGFVRLVKQHARWRPSSPVLALDVDNRHSESPTIENRVPKATTFNCSPTSYGSILNASPTLRHRLDWSRELHRLSNVKGGLACATYSRSRNVSHCAATKTYSPSQREIDQPSVVGDGATNATHQPKYAGIGVYPIVQLKSHRPALLSYCNSTMVKNRVTVKVALPERSSSNSSQSQSPISLTTPITTSSAPPSQCNTVIDALRSNRKRSLKEDAGTAIERSSAKRRHRQEAAPSCIEASLNDAPVMSHRLMDVTPPLESHQWEKPASFLPPNVPSELYKQSPPPPVVVGRSRTNAIHSSYSSSRRMQQNVANKSVKRKPESASNEAPDSKIGKSDTPQESSPAVTQGIQVDCAINEADILDDDVDVATTENTSGTSSSSSFHATPTGARSKMARLIFGDSPQFYVPNYIPTLDDYLEDRKSDHKRLQELLSCFSSPPEKTIDDANSKLPPEKTNASECKLGANIAVQDSFLPRAPLVHSLATVTSTAPEVTLSVAVASVSSTNQTKPTESNNLLPGILSTTGTPIPTTTANTTPSFGFVSNFPSALTSSAQAATNSKVVTTVAQLSSNASSFTPFSFGASSDPAVSNGFNDEKLLAASAGEKLDATQALVASLASTTATVASTMAPFSFGNKQQQQQQQTASPVQIPQFKMPELPSFSKSNHPVTEQKMGSTATFSFGASSRPSSNGPLVTEARSSSLTGSDGKFAFVRSAGNAVSFSTPPSSSLPPLETWPKSGTSVNANTSSSFGTSTSNSFSFGQNAAGGGGGGMATSFQFGSTGSSSFGGDSLSSSTVPQPPSFGAAAITTSTATPSLSFGAARSAAVSSSSFGAPTSTSNSTYSFGAVTAPTFSFGLSPAAAAATSVAKTTVSQTFTTTVQSPLNSNSSISAVPSFSLPGSSTTTNGFGNTVTSNNNGTSGVFQFGNSAAAPAPSTFSFGTQSNNNQSTASGMFTFGSVASKDRGSAMSGQAPTSSFGTLAAANQGFSSFNNSFKPALNFGPSLASQTATSETSMFSIGSGSVASSRRLKHPQRHRPHR